MGMGVAAATVVPQLEQKRAVYGNPAPHRLQYKAIINPLKLPSHQNHTRNGIP
jgi:hypothetical protein